MRAAAPTMWRDAKYGLRGVRVGEASQPGPGSDDDEFVPTPPSLEDDGMRARRQRVLHAAAQIGIGHVPPCQRRRRHLRIVGEDNDAADSPDAVADMVPATLPDISAPNKAARSVLAAANCFQNLADRIGAVAVDALIPAGMVLRQRWSDVVVPLMWAAARNEETCAIVDWLVSPLTSMDVQVPWENANMSGADAVRIAFIALKTAMRSWGIEDAEGFVTSFRKSSFRPRGVDMHFSA